MIKNFQKFWSFNFSVKSYQSFRHRKLFLEKSEKKIIGVYPNDLVSYRSKENNFKKSIGKVLKVNRKKNEVVVSGVNEKFKPLPPEKYFRQFDKGLDMKLEKRKYPHPIPLDKVKLLDPETKKSVSVIFKKTEDGERQRLIKNTQELLPIKNKYPTYKDRALNKIDGEKDTLANEVVNKSYQGEDFVSVFKNFVFRIREKERLEKLLILRDK